MCFSAGYTRLFGLKYIDIKLQTLQDTENILSWEKSIWVGISSKLSDRYVESDENKKFLYIDAKNLFGWAMGESLLFDEIEFETIVKLEVVLNIFDHSDFG